MDKETRQDGDISVGVGTTTHYIHSYDTDIEYKDESETTASRMRCNVIKQRRRLDRVPDLMGVGSIMEYNGVGWSVTRQFRKRQSSHIKKGTINITSSLVKIT
jgi:uncharacterized protein (DUF1786 family)